MRTLGKADSRRTRDQLLRRFRSRGRDLLKRESRNADDRHSKRADQGVSQQGAALCCIADQCRQSGDRPAAGSGQGLRAGSTADVSASRGGRKPTGLRSSTHRVAKRRSGPGDPRPLAGPGEGTHQRLRREPLAGVVGSDLAEGRRRRIGSSFPGDRMPHRRPDTRAGLVLAQRARLRRGSGLPASRGQRDPGGPLRRSPSQSSQQWSTRAARSA
jgi:hypothetical protein